MGVVTNFVGCGCLRKNDEVNLTENKPNDRHKFTSDPNDYFLQEETSHRNPQRSFKSNQIKMPIPEYFDGKIDAKDYIQKGDSIENYQKIKRIGKGSYGSVFKVMKKNTNLIRAMKVIPKNFQKDNDEILREIHILKHLDHPNVMKIYEFLEDDKNYYLIQEFCDGGDLDTILNGKKIYCEFLVKFIMYQVLLAINYLHSNNIVHQDIKKKNITIIILDENTKKTKVERKDILRKFVKLKTERIEFNNPISNNDDIFIRINEDTEAQEELKKSKGLKNLSKKVKEYLHELSKREVKVIDFGEALFMPQKKRYIDDISGTINYLSPELIRGQMIKELDEWACGVLMYYLLAGHPPFDGKTEDEIFDAIQNQPLDLNIEELKNVSNECKDLISKLLERDVNKRIKAKNALEHSFFKSGIKMKKIIGGMENKQTEKVLNTWIRLQKTHKQSNKNVGVFKKAVIAYMAFNFIEKEEEKKMKNLFHKLADGNNKFLITKENFSKTIREVTNNYSEEEINDLFNKLDENKSGIIEYEELVRGFSDREKLLNEKNMKEAFNFFDKDKNGYINWEEISNIVFQNKKMPKFFMKQFLEEIDQEKGKDVNITFEDFCKIIKNE